MDSTTDFKCALSPFSIFFSLGGFFGFLFGFFFLCCVLFCFLLFLFNILCDSFVWDTPFWILNSFLGKDFTTDFKCALSPFSIFLLLVDFFVFFFLLGQGFFDFCFLFENVYFSGDNPTF